MALIDDATALARQGFRVFPLRPKDKRPAEAGWQDTATSDVETVRKLWSNGHADCNIGIRTGNGLVVLDFDNKPGQAGLQSLAQLEALGLPGSYRVRTPSGGVHVYLRTPVESALGNSRGGLAAYPNVDVRGEGGYVVGPGSRTAAGDYVPELGEIAPIPEAISGLLSRRSRERDTRNVGSVGPTDTRNAIDRAVEYLISAPIAIQGDGGDDTTYRVACRVMDFGVSPATAYGLMLEHWNDNCQPPWSADELRTKVKNARRYRQEPIGIASTDADFEATSATGEPVQRDQPPAGTKYAFETVSDLRKLPAPRWLVKNWIPDQGIGFLTGKWGSGKTFLVFDLAMHLVYGMPDWHGAELPGEPRPVLIIAREGHAGFVDRIDAFKRRHGITADAPDLKFLRASVNVMVDRDWQALGAALAGQQFALVIVDTVARVIPGVDMSAPESITKFTERCSKLGEKTGAAVLGVHHRNKGGTTMGSIYFENNSDFFYEIERPEDAAGPLRKATIHCAKMKEGEDGWKREIRFETERWDLERSSLVVAHIGGRSTAEFIEPEDYADFALSMIRQSAAAGDPLNTDKPGRLNTRNAATVIAKALRIGVSDAERVIAGLAVDGLVEEYRDLKGMRLRPA